MNASRSLFLRTSSRVLLSQLLRLTLTITRIYSRTIMIGSYIILEEANTPHVGNRGKVPSCRLLEPQRPVVGISRTRIARPWLAKLLF